LALARLQNGLRQLDTGLGKRLRKDPWLGTMCRFQRQKPTKMPAMRIKVAAKREGSGISRSKTPA